MIMIQNIKITSKLYPLIEAAIKNLIKIKQDKILLLNNNSQENLKFYDQKCGIKNN